jgi:V/A-type H+-transporting ATPase subunit D
MSLGRVAVTRGVLLRLREQIEFTERGKELLKMKRDNLAAETNKLLLKVTKRKELESHLMNAYEALKAAYVSAGFSQLQSQSFTVRLLEARTRSRSVIGVLVPEIVLEKKPVIDSITNASVLDAANRLNALIEELLLIAEAEARIENIAQELMSTNRKVNALERVLIPNMRETMKYIEGRLDEETLEEFFRAKRVKAVIRGHAG